MNSSHYYYSQPSYMNRYPVYDGRSINQRGGLRHGIGFFRNAAMKPLLKLAAPGNAKSFMENHGDKLIYGLVGLNKIYKKMGFDLTKPNS